MRRNWQITAVSLALIAVGIAFLAASQVAYAGNGREHGDDPTNPGNSSGVPYWLGAAQVALNNTYYVSLYNTAMSEWNSATDQDYFLGWQSGGPQLAQYMVYSKSGQDTQLANFFGVNSCGDITDSNSNANGVAAFMYGHGSLNDDKSITVICLNVSAFGYPWPFDSSSNQSDESRRRGLEHEMGHSIHLAHASAGIMSVCWCQEIRQHDADVAKWIYASPP